MLSSILASVNKDSNDLKCHVHTLSPIKVAASGKCKYFNMTLQTSGGCKTAVCFSPEKRPILEKRHGDKSPIKISKIRFNSSYGKESVLIDRTSKITPIANDVGFHPTEISPSSVTSLLSLSQVSTEQLVTVKAKVAKISGHKKYSTD